MQVLGGSHLSGATGNEQVWRSERKGAWDAAQRGDPAGEVKKKASRQLKTSGLKEGKETAPGAPVRGH